MALDDDGNESDDQSKPNTNNLINETTSRKREYSLIGDINDDFNGDENETSTIHIIEYSNRGQSRISYSIPSPKIYIDDISKPEIIENKMTCCVSLKKRIKAKRICFYTKSQQTFYVNATIIASNHPKNEFTNGTLKNGSVKNILLHTTLTDIEEYAPECYLEHKFVGFLNIWETARHINTFRLLTQPVISNRIPRDIHRPKPKRGSFFHPIQVRRMVRRRNTPIGRLSINNGVITRVVWSRCGPRTIIVRKQFELKKFIIPTEDSFRRRVNIMYEYEFDVDDCNDYIETIRRVTGTSNNQIYNNNGLLNHNNTHYLGEFSSQF